MTSTPTPDVPAKPVASDTPARLPGDQLADGVTPLNLDQVGCSTELYGVKVAELGEDGDMGFVAFTHDERRALAALNGYARALGERTEAITLSVPRWWVVIDRCGCGDTCPHKPDADDFIEHGCQHYGLAPCIEDSFSWLGLYCTEGTPGALPVIEAEVSYR